MEMTDFACQRARPAPDDKLRGQNVRGQNVGSQNVGSQNVRSMARAGHIQAVQAAHGQAQAKPQGHSPSGRRAGARGQGRLDLVNACGVQSRSRSTPTQSPVQGRNAQAPGVRASASRHGLDFDAGPFNGTDLGAQPIDQ